MSAQKARAHGAHGAGGAGGVEKQAEGRDGGQASEACGEQHRAASSSIEQLLAERIVIDTIVGAVQIVISRSAGPL